MEPYLPEKEIWTDSDFERMSWHDNHIHGFSFNSDFKLCLDIDYIFKWVLKGKYYNFWMSPCTLVFDNILDFSMDELDPSDLTILEITREAIVPPQNEYYIQNNITEYEWFIEILQGEISFRSTGYRQYVRSKPKLNQHGKLNLEERGGISFTTTLTMQ